MLYQYLNERQIHVYLVYLQCTDDVIFIKRLDAAQKKSIVCSNTKDIKKGRLPFMSFSFHTWKDVTVPLDTYFAHILRKLYRTAQALLTMFPFQIPWMNVTLTISLHVQF